MVGDPLPANRNDCHAYRDSGIEEALTGRHVIADGAYHDNLDVISLYRKPRDGGVLADCHWPRLIGGDTRTGGVA